MLTLVFGNLVAIKMNSKKILTKEIAYRVKGKISEQIISETVNEFFKHGNMYLFMELINLKCEVKSLYEEFQQQKENKKQNAFNTLLVR
jgi:hypothetical protein